MNLAHIADPHIGFRRHERMAGGVNQRERDVAAAFRSAIDGVIAARPEVLVLAGDIFHRVSPGNLAIVFAHDQLQRVRQALPETPIVMIAGDHDSPRRSDSGCILRLFESLGVDVAWSEARQFVYPALDLRVVALPDTAVKCGDPWKPEGSEHYTVVVAHGEVEGLIPGLRDMARISPELLEYGWSYVALGHYHTSAKVGDRAWYAGATERTTTDVFGELKDEARHGVSGKGWLLADLNSGEVERHPIPAARLFLDLEEIEATGLTAPELDALIAERLAGQDIAGAVVHLRVNNCQRPVSRQLNFKVINQAKTTALHFNLDLRRPEIVHSPAAKEFLAMRRQPFDAMVTDFMAKRELTPGIERAPFLALARQTLDELDGREKESAA